MAFARPELLVSTDWLAAHLDDADLRVFECTVFLQPREGGGYRVEGGLAEWESGHIPGSGFLDLQRDFSDNEQRLRFMMPGEAAFAAAAGRHGIAETDRIVLYDRLGSMWAARLWWMFRAMGAERAAVLDGGWTKWLAEGRAVSTEPAAYAPASFNARFDAARFADREEMVATLDGGACVINALGRDQHSGADGGRTYGRAGHIPGSANVPAMELIDPETQAYLDAETLAARFAEVGAERDSRVITYCGGGIAASNDAFALSLLGYQNVAVYDASMSEWAADASLPLEVDS